MMNALCSKKTELTLRFRHLRHYILNNVSVSVSNYPAPLQTAPLLHGPFSNIYIYKYILFFIFFVVFFFFILY